MFKSVPLGSRQVIELWKFSRLLPCRQGKQRAILSLQSISRDVVDNVSQPRRLDPTMELITYSFVLYLQNGRHDVKYKPSMVWSSPVKNKNYAVM